MWLLIWLALETAAPAEAQKPQIQTPSCEAAARTCKKSPGKPACAQARKRCEDSQRVA